MTKEFNIIFFTVVVGIIFAAFLINLNPNKEPTLSIDIPEPVIEEVVEKKEYKKYEMGNYRQWLLMNNKKDFVSRISYIGMPRKLLELLGIHKNMQHDKGTDYYKMKRLSKELQEEKEDTTDPEKLEQDLADSAKICGKDFYIKIGKKAGFLDIDNKVNNVDNKEHKE